MCASVGVFTHPYVSNFLNNKQLTTAHYFPGLSFLVGILLQESHKASDLSVLFGESANLFISLQSH